MLLLPAAKQPECMRAKTALCPLCGPPPKSTVHALRSFWCKGNSYTMVSETKGLEPHSVGTPVDETVVHFWDVQRAGAWNALPGFLATHSVAWRVTGTPSRAALLVAPTCNFPVSALSRQKPGGALSERPARALRCHLVRIPVQSQQAFSQVRCSSVVPS